MDYSCCYQFKLLFIWGYISHTSRLNIEIKLIVQSGICQYATCKKDICNASDRYIRDPIRLTNKFIIIYDLLTTN